MPYFGASAFISWCMDRLIKPSSMHRSWNELVALYSQFTSHSFVLTVRIPYWFYGVYCRLVGSHNFLAVNRKILVNKSYWLLRPSALNKSLLLSCACRGISRCIRAAFMVLQPLFRLPLYIRLFM